MRCLFAGVLLLFFPGSLAANTDPGWFARVWQTDDGLPNNTVTAVAQTSDGYLWVTSPGPFARFDGFRFEQFTPSQIVPAYHLNARGLLETRDGSLWMAMAHGPVFRLKSGEVQVFTNNLPDAIVQQVIEDGEGAVWLNYPGGRLSRINRGKVESFSSREGWADEYSPASLACDSNGRLWFFKKGRIGIFRDGRFEKLPLQPPAGQIRIAGAKRTGGIWIGTGSRLFKYDDAGALHDLGAFQTDTSEADSATLLFEDRDGGVWIGTAAKGLFHYGPKGFRSAPTSHSQILSVIEDREGNIWVGTGGGGLNRLQPRTVYLETGTNGVSLEALRSICEGRDGILWGVSQNGALIRRTGNEWSAVSTNTGWAGDISTCVAADPDGAIWVTGRSRLHRFHEGRWTTWTDADGLRPNWIHALHVSASGDLYLAGTLSESVQRFRGGRFHTFRLPPNVKYARAIAEDTAGNIWIGTSRGFLLRITGDTLTDETIRTFGSLTSIRSLHATPDGSLWIAFAGGGLGWINRDGRFSRIMTRGGLLDNYLSQVISDSQGWLWFGSDHGIFKARLRDLEDVAMKRASAVRCVNYGRNAGLPGLQANFGQSPGYLRASDGRLWMPMRTGLAVVHPEVDPANPDPPLVMLKRVVMDETEMAAPDRVLPAPVGIHLSSSGTALRLPPRHQRLKIEYTAPGLSAPESVNFRYRMEGLEKNWIESGPERSANYSRLPTGEYQFQLAARNGDGQWSETLLLAISVAPFVWQTWWFRLGFFVVFTVGVIAMVRYLSFRRLRLKVQMLEQQAAVDRERARIARDIHDDLGGNLTQVALLCGLTQRDWSAPATAADYVQRISETTHQAIRSLDEIVWAANPRNDTVRDAIHYLAQFAVDFLRTAGIQCHVDLPDDPPVWPIPSEVRHNVFLAVKEALNNITRHAHATEVSFRAITAGGSVRLILQDNGRGFETSRENAFADGLQNIRQRMAEIGGHCEIESVPGKGARVSLICPENPRIRSTIRH